MKNLGTNKRNYVYRNCIFEGDNINIKFDNKYFFTQIPSLFFQKKERKFFFTINYTNLCNLNCDYCYRCKSTIMKENSIKPETLLDLLFEMIDKKLINKYDEFIFSFGLSSEPMLDLSLLKQLFIKISERENYLFEEDDFINSLEDIVQLLKNELNIVNEKKNGIDFLNEILFDRELKNKIEYEICDIENQSRYLLYKDKIHISKIVRLNRRIIESKFKDKIKKKQQKFYTFWCMSNGTIVNDDIIDFIHEADITPFWISLDLNKKSHDFHRKFYNGTGSYDIVVKNIEKMIERGVEIKLSTVITNSSDDILSCLYCFQNLGIKKINMTFCRDKNLFSTSNLLNLMNQYRRIYEQLKNDILKENYNLLLFLSEDKITEPLRFLLRREKMVHRCDWNRQLIIDSTGDCWPCLYFSKYEKYKISNLNSKLTINKKNISNKDSFTRECNKCFAKYLCGGYCKYTAILENEDITKKSDFECNLRRFFVEEVVKLLIDLYNENYDLKKLYYEFIDKL